MRTVRLPLLRGALFIIALAAISILLARGDNPAQATTFEPQTSISVSDPNPGANADISINFSIDKPDSFPNIKTNPAIQFLPRAWGIHTPTTERTDGVDTAPAETGAQCTNSSDDDGDGFVNDGCPGAFAGTFNALTTLGLFGASPCGYALAVPFTLMDATTDTGYDEATGAYDPQKLASSFDLGGDAHPGGPGFSGEFVDDLNTIGTPGDLNLPLTPFNANEKFYQGSGDPHPYMQWRIYRDVDGSNNVSAGDILLNDFKTLDGNFIFPAGAVVTDSYEWRVVDLGGNLFAMPATVRRYDSNGNGVMDPGEDTIYQDNDWNNKVSYGDQRLFWFVHLNWGSIVQEFALPGGVTRYPDFLNQMFHPEVIGDPLARMFGAQDVLGNAVPLNLVTFRPGQLPGYPANLGYPTVVVVLNPVAPVDASIINLTSDLCAPLSLVSTNLGISKDNPGTFANEGGYVRLSNPAPGQKGWQGEKGYDFTLIVTSQPDAEDADRDGVFEGDGIENMLDSCPFDPNIEDVDGRSGSVSIWDINPAGDPDNDGLDGACDPVSYPPPDLGRALVPFNPDEKWWGYNAFHQDNRSSLYRDNDGDNLVTPGDERLTPRELFGAGALLLLQPGAVQDGDADYRDPATGAVRSAWDRALRAFASNFKHAENVAENGAYDAIEDIYREQCRSSAQDCPGGEVTLGDERHLFEGREIGWGFGENVFYGGQSPEAPWFYIVDDDQDNFGNRGDNCSVVSNGIEVIGSTYVRLRNLSFTVLTYGNLIGPGNQTDTDMDDIGDACEGSEHGNVQCGNDLDDDGDGAVNDGCPTNPYRAAETWAQCANAVDDDGDGKINDGCPAVGEPETGDQCGNLADDDADGSVNDGCPVAGSIAETDRCNDSVDDDNDGLVNDGCPAVDPGDAAKTTPTGHKHVVTITNAVPIFKHGIKLANLGGPDKIKDNGARTYTVDVVNLSGSDSENVQVALQVVEGCATVNGAVGENTAEVSVAPGESGSADFTVDFTGCTAGPYTVQADACHGGDAAPAGFFGAGGCPGSAGHGTLETGLVPLASAIASSEIDSTRAAVNAIDGDWMSDWCSATANLDPNPVLTVYTTYSSSIDSLTLENDLRGPFGASFYTGTITMSNGFSMDVTLDAMGEGSFTFPTPQTGVGWVRFTSVTKPYQIACFTEVRMNGSWYAAPPDPNPLDDAPTSIGVEVGTTP